MIYAKIVKNFLFKEEIFKLNKWTIQNWKNPYFQDAHMDSLHPNTRFTTRMQNDLVAKDVSVNINYPKECYNIQDRIKNFFHLHEFDHPPSFYNGIVNGIGFSPGMIEDHIDPVYIQGTNTLHCNIITQNSISGGVTIIEGVEYNISEGDLLMYVVSKHYHHVTQIEGNRERILWVFGFCVDDDKLEQIFN
jgi:hypothetical protein